MGSFRPASKFQPIPAALVGHDVIGNLLAFVEATHPSALDGAIWLYLRFTLSLRDVEDLLAERGVAVSYETVRCWVNHFGPMIAADLRKRRVKPHTTWHLDEVYLKIDGRMVYLWRAVDAGEVLDVLVQSERNKHAALRLMRKARVAHPPCSETLRRRVPRTARATEQYEQ